MQRAALQLHVQAVSLGSVAIMQKKLRRMFKYLIVDELHEHKSDESAQSMACSKLIGAVDHVLGLTGTIIGGYAHHLYP